MDIKKHTEYLMDQYNVNDMCMKTYPMPTDFPRNILCLMTECYFRKTWLAHGLVWKCSLSQNNSLKSMRWRWVQQDLLWSVKLPRWAKAALFTLQHIRRSGGLNHSSITVIPQRRTKRNSRPRSRYEAGSWNLSGQFGLSARKIRPWLTRLYGQASLSVVY